MQLTTVESSMLYAVGYDESSQQLDAVFWSGVYRYFDVPKEVYEGLIAANSKGQYMRAYVIDQYRSRQLRS